MKVLSLFDGCSGAYQALLRAGTKIDKYYASEIDPYAIAVSKSNFPEIVHIGSVTGVQYEDGAIFHNQDNNPMVNGGSYITEIDLLVGGSPCQDLSIAKANRKGLDGERSGLFYEYVRILNEVKPKYFILENVASMPKEAKAEITKILGVEPIMINSALVTAQNRKRLYWVGKRTEDGTYKTVDIPQPEDRHIYLRDILEDMPLDNPMWKPLDEKYLNSGKIRINEATKLGYIEPISGDCVDMAQENSKTRRGRLMREKSNCLDTSNKFFLLKEKSKVITATYSRATPRDYFEKNSRQIIICNKNPSGQGQNGNVYGIYGKSPTLTTNKGEGIKIGVEYFWRPLTVRECARLQGMGDDFDFSEVSKSQAYKMIGNGFNIPTIAHILSFIK